MGQEAYTLKSGETPDPHATFKEMTSLIVRKRDKLLGIAVQASNAGQDLDDLARIRYELEVDMSLNYFGSLFMVYGESEVVFAQPLNRRLFHYYPVRDDLGERVMVDKYRLKKRQSLFNSPQERPFFGPFQRLIKWRSIGTVVATDNEIVKLIYMLSYFEKILFPEVKSA